MGNPSDKDMGNPTRDNRSRKRMDAKGDWRKEVHQQKAGEGREDVSCKSISWAWGKRNLKRGVKGNGGTEGWTGGGGGPLQGRGLVPQRKEDANLPEWHK